MRRWHELGLDAQFGDAGDPEIVDALRLQSAAWIVCSVPQQGTGLSHEDTRSTLIQLARSAGFRGRVAVTSHTATEMDALLAYGADLVLRPFQDAADRAVDLLCGDRGKERTEIPEIATEERRLT